MKLQGTKQATCCQARSSGRCMRKAAMAPYIANSLRGAQQCAGSLLFKAHQHLSQLPGRKDCALRVVGSQTGLPELQESVCEV